MGRQAGGRRTAARRTDRRTARQTDGQRGGHPGRKPAAQGARGSKVGAKRPGRVDLEPLRRDFACFRRRAAARDARDGPAVARRERRVPTADGLPVLVAPAVRREDEVDGVGVVIGLAGSIKTVARLAELRPVVVARRVRVEFDDDP